MQILSIPKAKIAYFLSHPIQYFSPLLVEMSKQFDLHVYYFSDASIKGNMDKGFGQKVKWDIPLLEGYQYTFLKNFSPRKSLSNRMWDVINPGVIGALIKCKCPVVIVNGWSYFSTLLTILTAKLLGKEVWLRAENPLNQELKKSKLVIFVKKIVLKHLLFHFVNKFLYIGTENKNFLEFYGVSENRMIYTPYAVDNTYWRNQHLAFINIKLLKQSLHLPADKKIILFTGKYISKKKPLDLLKAFKQLNYPDSLLLMVGEGELRNEMEKYVTENKLENVVLTGFINQSEIPKYYEVADVFVMCSGTGETWGLSVNEAMNFEKPVIVSKTCGCCRDLVKNEINGFSFEEGDIDSLTTCLQKILSNNFFSTAAGKASSEIIREYSIENIVNNLVRFGRFDKIEHS